MKYCSECQKCYDDSFVNCEIDKHETLIQTRINDSNLIEGYEISSFIESETPVELFRAKHIDSDKKVVIGFIKLDDSKDKLRKELKSYTSISHQSLCKIYECGETIDGLVYIVSEDLEGKTLRDYLNESGTLDERQSITIARQIAEGLEKLHKSEIVHRFINPKTIYICKTNENELSVKLNYPDFSGIVEQKIVENANSINAKSEIFEYYSPEQFGGNELNFKSDLYSLAVVFYEMLLGRTPYELLSPQTIGEYIFNESDTDKLNHDLRGLISYSLRECLQQRLSLRPHSTDKLIRQLRHLELVATPSDPFVEVEEKPTKPKWTQAHADREKVIEELKRKIPEKYSETNENQEDIPPKYERVILSEKENDFEEYLVNKVDSNASPESEKRKEETIEDLGVVDENTEVEYLPITAGTMKSENIINSNDSFTFKKSHVYATGFLATLLIGSLFFVSLYNQIGKANPVQTVKEQENTKPIPKKEKDDIGTVEPQINEQLATNDAKEDNSIELDSRDIFLKERAENKTPETTENKITTTEKKIEKKAENKQSSPKKVSIKKDKKEETKTTKPEKTVFENKVIVVGNNKSTKKKSDAKNVSKTKKKKVFSDVVITY